MRSLLGLTQSSFDPASWFRFIQFVPYLRKAGWTVEHRPNRPDRQWRSNAPTKLLRAVHYRAGRLLMKMNRLRDVANAESFGAIFVNRDFAAEDSRLQKRFQPLMRRTIFDFDDAIFVGPKEGLVRWMCENACWVTPGNEYLANYARRFTNRVTVIPTVIDTELCRPRDYDRPSGSSTVRVGWSGSDQSIQATLVPYLPMLASLQREVDFELVIITNSRPQLPVENLRWKFCPWRREEEPFLESKFDIGIMPLVDDSFQKGKCALKLLQYMAAGLPTVASPVGVNAHVVQNGVTGFLARTDLEWRASLENLIRNEASRRIIGSAGRQLCEREYSIRSWLPVLLEILELVQETAAAEARPTANEKPSTARDLISSR